MAYAVLMSAVLIVSFVLMFVLVNFAEGIISGDPPTEESATSAREP